MTQPDSRLELRHLRVLRALLAESSVSRAADILGQSQPAISATLRQLRDLFGDPLLVRSGAGMVRTERAQAIAEAVGRVLDEIDELVSPPGVFEPETSTRHIRIVTYLGLGSLLVPALVQAIRAEAPHVRLEIIQPSTPEITRQQLHDGEVDIVIANRQDPFQNLRFAPLMDYEIACVLSAAHPLSKKGSLTLEEYLALEHLSPSSSSVVAGAPIDGRLLEIGRRRNVTVTVPEFALARHILPETCLVFTTARPYAEEIAANLQLAILDAPPELGRISAFLFWHEKTHHSASGKWLRAIVRAVAERSFRRGDMQQAL